MNQRLTAILFALMLAAAAAAPAPRAYAGEFVVTSCGESPTSETAGWTLTPSTSTLETGTQCPPVLDQPGTPAGNRSQHTGIFLNDRLGVPTDSPPGAAVSATFNTAPGTTVTRARIWRWYAQFNDASWRMLGSTLEGRPLDQCTVVMGGCGFGNPNYLAGSEQPDGAIADFIGLSTAGIRYRLSCEAPAGTQCSNGATLYRAALSLFGAKLTINDPSSPAQQTPAGALWTATGYQRGTLALNAAATDNTGISSTQLLVDAAVAAQSPRSCNYSRPAPCTSEPGAPLSVNTATIADGPHTIAVRALDAASNPATLTRPSTLLIDNNPPAAPQNLRSDGPTTRSTNAWSLSWELPPDPGSPIVRARYTICPAANPASSSCTSGQADGQSITQLPPFALPGPGAWDVRVSLEDQTGLSDTARSSPITLTYQATSTTTTTTPTPPRPTTTTAPPPPPPTNTTPPTPAPSSPPRSSARLRLTRAHATRSGLRVVGTTTTLATGPVRVTFSQRIGGRTLRATRTARLARGRFALTLRLPGRLARTRSGRLTLSYAGSTRVRPATLHRTLRRA